MWWLKKAYTATQPTALPWRRGRYASTVTDRQGNWIGQPQVYANSYADPVVLGQVMTENDVGFSVFWSRGASPDEAPTGSTLYTGKHVGEDSDTTRADETIGYVVVEAGIYTINGMDLVAGLGSVTVSGVENSTALQLCD